MALAVLLPGCGQASRSRPPTSSAVPAPTAAGSTGAVAPATAAGACGWTAEPPQAYEHVVWIWMENHSFKQVIGNEAAPYATALAHQCGTASSYATVGSPSLPNYLGATSGNTHGINDDGDPAIHPLNVQNLFGQVRASGRTEASYQEGMRGTCQLTSAGRYAVKHNPAAYYSSAGDRAACQVDDVPLGTTGSGLLRDALTSGSLPAFAFITPDLCNDTHDCPVATGDAWLGSWLPMILASDVYRAGRTAVFVVWDEPTPMPNLIVAPSVRPGTVDPDGFDHYSLLRTTEELLGLDPRLGHAASAASMRPGLHL